MGLDHSFVLLTINLLLRLSFIPAFPFFCLLIETLKLVALSAGLFLVTFFVIDQPLLNSFFICQFAHKDLFGRSSADWVSGTLSNSPLLQLHFRR